MSNDKLFGCLCVGVVGGISGFFWGFMRLRRKRLIENIPTSNIRSLAIGLVELTGKATSQTSLLSPLTKTKCVYFKYLIERYESRGKNSSWVTVAKGDSCGSPFWLNDETGRILVFPQKAEMILPKDYEFTSSWGRQTPPHLMGFMHRYSGRSLFGSQSLRFSEWHIREDQNVYILGTAKLTGHTISDHNKKLVNRLNSIKKDPKHLAQFDTNKDGKISLEEWDITVQKINQELIEEELKNAKDDSIIDVIITQGETERIFMISDQNQNDLTKRLSFQSALGIIGGLILSFVCGLLLIILYFS